MSFWKRGNYAFNTVENIVNLVKHFGKFAYDTWYVGITSNSVRSLKAHGINTDNQMSSEFDVWDIPFESAKACKEALLSMDGYDFISDDESDFIDDTYPNSFIYLYRVDGLTDTVQHIDVSDFKPVKSLPLNHIIVTEVSRDDEKIVTRYDDEFDKAACDQLIEEIRQKFIDGKMKFLKIVHRSTIEMWFEFGEGCCTISYDARTSQEGYIQSYRNGSRSRKQVPFFDGMRPEYMVCRDIDEFTAILRYFLEKDRKPGKRQNVKWVVIKGENLQRYDFFARL